MGISSDYIFFFFGLTWDKFKENNEPKLYLKLSLNRFKESQTICKFKLRELGSGNVLFESGARAKQIFTNQAWTAHC